MPHDVAQRFASLHNLIGDTPLIEVHCRFRGKRLCVYAKHEVANFTGSDIASRFSRLHN